MITDMKINVKVFLNKQDLSESSTRPTLSTLDGSVKESYMHRYLYIPRVKVIGVLSKTINNTKGEKYS